MKNLKSTLLPALSLSLSLSAAFADMTRYGFSGINFVPSEDKAFGPDLHAGYSWACAIAGTRIPTPGASSS